MTAIAGRGPSTGHGSTVGHVFEHRCMQYRRTFRASIFSSFLSPVLFLTAMGLGLGSYVNSSGVRVDSAA